MKQRNFPVPDEFWNMFVQLQQDSRRKNSMKWTLYRGIVSNAVGIGLSWSDHSTEGDHLHTEWFHARQTTGGTRSCGLLEQVKCFGMTLLVSTTACGAEWRTFIQEMKLVQKPNFQSCVSSTSNVVKCLYASKEMSFIFCRCWRFSKDCLPFIKPVWSGWGILFKTVSSHRAKALESILLSQQTRLAGLYESHFDGSLPLLRWTDITAWDRVGGSHPCWNATGAV